MGTGVTRLLRPLLLLVFGRAAVRPLDEADDGPAGPHAQEVHRDEEPGEGCGETSAEQVDRRVRVIFDNERDENRDDDQEKGQVNPSHSVPPARETGVEERTPGTRTLSGPTWV